MRNIRVSNSKLKVNFEGFKEIYSYVLTFLKVGLLNFIKTNY